MTSKPKKDIERRLNLLMELFEKGHEKHQAKVKRRNLDTTIPLEDWESWNSQGISVGLLLAKTEIAKAFPEYFKEDESE